MSTDTEIARQETINKSRSDSEITSPPSINRSASQQHRRIFIDDISTCEGQAGDRVWATCSGIDDTINTIDVDMIGNNFREAVLDVSVRNQLIMFTIPSLKIEEPGDLELRFRISDENKTTIPFKYIPRIPRSASIDLTLFENLMEFANNGDPISLLYPFVSQISKTDIEGNTVLHSAANSSQSFALKLFLSVLADNKKSEIINLQNKHGLTALHCAIRCGDPDAVHYLMNHGARIDISDGYGNTALHYLADAYNESIFKEILEPSRDQRFDINQFNNEGYAPIHVAVRRLKLSLIEMLIEANALIDILDGEKKRNALMHAIEMNDFETIQLLVERGSNTNIEDTSNDTALSLAVKNVNYPVIGLLIDNGADPRRKNGKGVSLTDSTDTVIENIINGDRPELPKKESFSIPNDLAASRSPLFGRSHPDKQPSEETQRNRLVKRSRDEILQDAQTLIDEPEPEVLLSRTRLSTPEQIAGPSTSTGASTSRRSRRNGNGEDGGWERGAKNDDICNLDYLTRIRVSKLFDDQAKWQPLAKELGCDHMIELISICSGDEDSSPTMILLDQFEQLTNSSISKLREAMNKMGEEEGVKLIDQRYVY